VADGTPTARSLRVALDTEATHHLQEAGVIGEPKLLGGVRDVPFVALERGNDYLPLCLKLLFLKTAWGLGRGAWARAFVVAELGRDIVAS
jgi:hypothetical protein